MSAPRRRVRKVVPLLLVPTLTALVAGCGGDDGEKAGVETLTHEVSSEGSELGETYSAADAKRLANVAPQTPGWPPWPQAPEPNQTASETPEEAAAKDPIYAEYRRRTAHLPGSEDDANGSGNKWKDDDKLANLATGVFASADDAHVGFLASNDLSLGYGDMYGSVIKVEAVEELGDEAWRLWANGNGTQVTYQWRRNNLVVEVHVHCYGDCPSDVDAAARAWADAIDEEARSAKG